MKHIKEQNIKLLLSINDLIASLDNGKYAASCDVIFNGTIGQHVRHIIEFYQSILETNGSVICYDDRKRNLELEMNPTFAISTINCAVTQIELLGNDCSLHLKGNYSETDEAASQNIKTSLAREMAYAFDHTVHHLALCKIALKHLGVNVHPDLGVAPSTIRQRNQVCAH